MAAKTNGDIYKLLGDLRLELKGDIGKVADQLTALDKVVSDNEVRQAISSTKIGMLITGISLVVSGITTVIVEKISGGFTR